MRLLGRVTGIVRRDGESGFTVIEAAVAATVLAVGALAVLGMVSATTRNNFRAEQSQVVNDQLQQQMEQIKQLPYRQIALTRTPTGTGDAASPNSRVTGTTFNVNRSGNANYEPLAYNGGTNPGNGATVSAGSVDPGPVPFRSGNVTGSVYRYVTWESDPSCGNSGQSDCGERYYKRITIVVALDSTAPGGTRVYQEIQGYMSNPNAGLPPSQGGEGGQNEGGPGTGLGGNDTPTPWTFWLTDTPCAPEPPDEQRQPITQNHSTHNTLGSCPAGMQTGGAVPGAPDLMVTDAYDCGSDGCASQQPLYDYATDVEPNVNPDQDAGLQELSPPDPTGLGCTVNIDSLTNLSQLGSTPAQATPWLYVHKWVSRPMPAGFNDVILDGTGLLNLWTQSINGENYPGAICVWLFVRQTVAGAPVDTFALNLDRSGNPTYFRYSQLTWPTTRWSEISVPLHFTSVNAQGVTQALHVPAGARLGLAIGVERQGTDPNSGLQFMYDAPTFDSRLQLDTHSVIPGL